MSTQILATKLYVPVQRPGSVLRPRLIARLNPGAYSKLTLISAPAGFGKTTLVTEWIADTARPVAWLSLDEGDSDPIRFLTYVVAAMQTIAPEMGTGLLNLLQAPQPPPIETLLTPLLNALAALPQEFVLVLDDYHVLDSTEIDSALTYLMDNQPPQMHLVITTREDPRLPLARQRGRGQLTELRAADLRFTAEEAAEFLNHAMGLALSSEDVTALEQRTEGWIAGLQLAAISMQGIDNRSAFIHSFTGSHHFVLDYLIEEVLEHQPQHTHDFLLKTSILNRMSGPLCASILEVTEQTATDRLEQIRQSNLFLTPLDNERCWYRYHHLFGDLLLKHLQQAVDIDVNALHLRASDWYETNGFELEAFRHAAAAGDVERVERIIEGKNVPLYLRGMAGPVLHWFGSLSREILDANPSLWVTYAAALTVTGQQIDTVEDKLKAADIAWQQAPENDRSHDLRGRIAAIRAMLAGPVQDIETMLSQSNQALELLHPEDLSIRALVLWTKGLAHQYRGESDTAGQIYAAAIPVSQETGNTMVMIAALTCLGQIQEANREFTLAEQSYERVLALVGDPPWPMACESFLGLARLKYQQDDLYYAEEYATRGLELGHQIENVGTPIDCCLVLARIKLAHGDLDGAASILAEGERLIEQRGFSDRLPHVRAEQSRIEQALAHSHTPRTSQPLIEPLSERELEVLHLVADGLSNREIGDRLYLALDTIKGHNRRIYAKLGVQRRTEAIARARELGLI
jgi:LuxR family maltose regulon positive regulatory protein